MRFVDWWQRRDVEVFLAFIALGVLGWVCH